MQCSETRELIQLYLDNELDARATLRVQQHLESCRGCERIMEDLSALDRLLKKGALEDKTATDALRTRILAQIKAGERRPGPNFSGWFSSKFAWKRLALVAATGMVVALLVTRGDWLPPLSMSVYAAAAEDHSDHCSVAIVGVLTSDRSELERLAIRFTPFGALPDLSSFGYQRLRGRVCVMHDHEFLHLVFYDRRQTPLSIFLRPHATGLIHGSGGLFVEQDHRVAARVEAGVDILAVSSVDEHRTASITQAVALQLKRP